MLRKDPPALIEAAKNEHLRRGEPVKTTRWCVEEISRYMSYKLATTPAHGDIGAYARKLPKARGTDPAPIPQEVSSRSVGLGGATSLAPLVAHQALSTKRKAPPPPPVAPVADPGGT